VTATELTSLIAQLLYLAVFVRVLVDVIRRPRRANVDALLFFGILTVIVVIAQSLRVLGIALSPEATTTLVVVLLALPYVLLRLADDYRGVRRWIKLAAGAGLVVAIALVVAVPAPYSAAIGLLLSAYFVAVFAYCAYAFAREAIGAPSVERQRMRAVAVGTALFTATIALSGVRAVVPPDFLDAAGILSSIASLGSGAAFFVGFAPPAAVVRFWREAPLRQFIQTVARLGDVSDQEQVLRRLEAAAGVVMGGGTVAVSLYDESSGKLRTTLPDGTVLESDPADSLSGIALRARRPVMSDDPSREFPQMAEIYARYDIRALLAAPILIGDRIIGMLAVRGTRPSLFARDDLGVLGILADQAAIAIENARLLAQVRALHEEERRHGRAAQARLAAIVESSPDAITGQTVDGTLTDWNQGAERLYGYSADEIVDRPSVALSPPDRQGEMSEILARVGAGERVEQFETVRMRKDGSAVHVSLSFAPIRDEHGAIVGVAAVARDISERRASEARIRAMVDASLDAVVGMDQHGDVIEWNHQAEVIFGRSRQETLGQPLVSLIIPERYREAHRAGLERYRRTGEGPVLGTRLELEALDRDGREFPIELSITAVAMPDGPLFSAFIRDITERRNAARLREELDARLRQSERLEGLGRLAGGVAHDLNNILAITSNYADFVAQRLPPGDPSRDDVAQIQHAAERGAAFTRQLLTFARRGAVQPSELRLNQLLRDMRSMLGRSLRENISFDIRVPPDLWSVLADRGQIDQLVLNLVVNASDAMPEGGRLLVEATNADYDEVAASQHADLRPGRYVLLAVTDTGPGMSPEVLARAFEPFFTTKPKGQGTGLGLATVYGVVQQAGGRVSLYSEVGQGTSVRVHLPAIESSTSNARAAAPPPATAIRAGSVILVVEDEDAVRQAARRILVGAGCEVLEAADGQAALALSAAREGKVDLLLTDMVMPGMSGRELARRLRASRPDIRVAYMSGYAEDLPTPGQTLDGPLVTKPFTRVPLLEVVGAALEGTEEDV
jgi:PAS domain S-box-containing protein